MNSEQLISKVCTDLVIPESVKQRSPHLSDKMVVDLINGIELIEDHNKVSKSVSDNPLKRFMGAVSGSSRVRQDLINKNVAGSLDTVAQWLSKHDSDFLIVNNSISLINDSMSKLSGKLLETRQGVMQLDQKLNTSVDQLMSMIENLDKVTSEKTQQLQDHIQTVDLRSRAQNQLFSEYKRWEAGGLEGLSLILRAYTYVDNLRNGAFSVYYSVADHAEKERLIKDVKNTLLIRLSDDLGVKPQNCKLGKLWIPTLESFNSDMLEKDDLCSISYLSSWATKSKPVTYAIHKAASESYDDIPHIFNMHRWIDRSVNEQLVRVA